MATLGENIRRYREHQGMTMQNLADECGVTKQYISEYENDRHSLHPSLVILEKIASVLHINPALLLGWEECEKEQGIDFPTEIKKILEDVEKPEDTGVNAYLCGERIKYYRQRLKISKYELGKRSGLAPSTISKYESGMTNGIASDVVEKIAKALLVSPGILLGWEEETIKGTGLNRVCHELKMLLVKAGYMKDTDDIE